jgi:ABC-2 type transport system ATP-binding protein
MIEAHQLCKQFGNFHAVRHISLTIEPGEVLALLGPNGAGKTTTVRMFAAILKPTSGWVRIDGLDVVQHAREVRSRVGLLTEYPGLYGRMRALEYLHFFGALLGLDETRSQQRAEYLLRQFGLWEVRDKRLDSYSKGMRQKIALVRSLIHDPPVLFLDEPTTAMDPQSARTVRDAIDELRTAERTILLTTHNLTEAEELADRIAIIRGGQIVAQGTMQELMRQLMGAPIWQVQFAAPDAVQHARSILADLVTVEEEGRDFIRYRCSDAAQMNPRIMSRLIEHNLPLISFAEVQRNLEDVYLQIVSQQEEMDRQATPGDAAPVEPPVFRPEPAQSQPHSTRQEEVPS